MLDGVTNILVCGIGGQGIMTATEILAQCAIDLGHDAKKTEVAGMSQRGGVVTSHLRFGRQVLSPQIATGCADLLVGFEAAETLRWAHMLRPGAMALMNVGRIKPPVVNIGLFDYPEDPAGQLRDLGIDVRTLDASAIAIGLGDIRLGNTVMLGFIAEQLPFPPEVLCNAVLARFTRRKPQMLDANRRAFEAGREAFALAAA